MTDPLSSSELLNKRCVPCEGGVPVLTADQIATAKQQIPAWDVTADEHWIERKFNLRNFVDAVDLLNRIATLAEAEQHHPDLHLTGYRHLTVRLTTHAIGGLSENDLILAAKIDQVVVEARTK